VVAGAVHAIEMQQEPGVIYDCYGYAPVVPGRFDLRSRDHFLSIQGGQA
jgi:hypothetical protein